MARTRKQYSCGQSRRSNNPSPRKSAIKRYSGSKQAEKASLESRLGGRNDES